MNDDDAYCITLRLLRIRASETSICPSEIARALLAALGSHGALEDWRSAMPLVHAAIDRLLTEGLVRLSWKGRELVARAGPYRVSRGARYEQPQ